MTAQIIDGTALAQQLREQMRHQVEDLINRGVTPGLAVILVGKDPASQVYVRNKAKACEAVGIHSILDRLNPDISEHELLQRVQALNSASDVHGILVQLPLPEHIDANKVITTISPGKDVDGFHVSSAGALMVGQNGFRPCTPFGCMKMLESIDLKDLRGKHAVVIGRSNIVGKPMAMMLLAAGATVTICHSGTPDLGAVTRQGDILVSAVGKSRLVTRDMVKPGAVVIDVGMNRDENGRLCGDVDFDEVRQVAGWITPVPGGVGPMTITMLLANTIASAQHVTH